MNHDPTLITKHGDDLEKHWAEMILNSIPSYAAIWSTYVGNDGQQKALPMSKPNADAEQERIIIWQWLYTLFESMALSWEIEAQARKGEVIKNQHDYASNLNAWIAFYAHLGRIHDMAERIAERLDQKCLFASFDSFYEQRHIALHGIKVPMRWLENVLCAPELGEKPNEWHSKASWGALAKPNFQFLSDHFAKTLRDLERVVEAFCSQVFRLLPSRGLSPVIWPSCDGGLTVNKAIPFAGTQSCEPLDQPTFQSLSGVQNYPSELER